MEQMMAEFEVSSRKVNFRLLACWRECFGPVGHVGFSALMLSLSLSQIE